MRRDFFLSFAYNVFVCERGQVAVCDISTFTAAAWKFSSSAFAGPVLAKFAHCHLDPIHTSICIRGLMSWGYLLVGLWRRWRMIAGKSKCL